MVNLTNAQPASCYHRQQILSIVQSKRFHWILLIGFFSTKLLLRIWVIVFTVSGWSYKTVEINDTTRKLLTPVTSKTEQKKMLPWWLDGLQRLLWQLLDFPLFHSGLGGGPWVAPLSSARTVQTGLAVANLVGAVRRSWRKSTRRMMSHNPWLSYGFVTYVTTVTCCIKYVQKFHLKHIVKHLWFWSSKQRKHRNFKNITAALKKYFTAVQSNWSLHKTGLFILLEKKETGARWPEKTDCGR